MRIIVSPRLSWLEPCARSWMFAQVEIAMPPRRPTGKSLVMVRSTPSVRISRIRVGPSIPSPVLTTVLRPPRWGPGSFSRCAMKRRRKSSIFESGMF